MFARRRRVAAAALAVVCTFGRVPAAAPQTATPAAPAAGPTGFGEVGYRERNVWAGYREPPVEVATPATGIARRPARFCLRLPLPNQEAPPTGRGSWTAAEMRALASRTPLDLTPGAWHTLACYVAGEDLPYLVTVAEWTPADPTAGNATTIEGVEAYARSLLATPAPAVATSPPVDRQITGLATWFAVGGVAPAPRSAQAGPLWATAEAIAVGVALDPGDGREPVVCTFERSSSASTAPGTTVVVPAVPQAAPSCLHTTYTEIERRTGTAVRTAQLRLRYAVYLITSDDPIRRLADTLTGDATQITLTVREIQTVLR